MALMSQRPEQETHRRVIEADLRRQVLRDCLRQGQACNHAQVSSCLSVIAWLTAIADGHVLDFIIEPESSRIDTRHGSTFIGLFTDEISHDSTNQPSLKPPRSKSGACGN